ncbi:MAG: MFS transporter [Planctomycetes bacterium]|nr:MFS transporter [Planctomycetota bacterium]
MSGAHSAGAGSSPRLTATQWLICAIASIGFAFDIYELLMLPLILRPALAELAKVSPGSPEFLQWRDLLFYVPALCGGVFGLLGGYLTDLFGRRRILTWSILLYAFSALGAGFATSMPMLLVLRCTTFVGVCLEFVAAVAWLAELFPDPRRREAVLGLTQAFSSLGGFLVAGAYWLAGQLAQDLPAIQGVHAAWRYTLISGVIPALPLILIRPFLPESPVWARKRADGTLKRPSFLALFAPEHRRTTVVTTILVACSFGAAFGAIQHVPQMIPGLAEVKDLPKAQVETVVSHVQLWQEGGGLLGRAALAGLVLVVARQRRLLRIFQVPGLILVPLVFWFPARDSLELLKSGIALAGFLTVAQFSFWGNYLPRVYPTHLRGTGESFAANVGGRMIGTSAALLTTWIQKLVGTISPALGPPARVAVAAAAVALFVYAVGSIACFFLPEPRGAELPE